MLRCSMAEEKHETAEFYTLAVPYANVTHALTS